MAAGAAGRHGRWFDLLATAVIGVVVVGAALVPAATANSGETTTIRGDVAVGGDRLAFFPVGFWVPGTGVVGEVTRTDANGVFTLDVPASLDGYAFAGTAPDAPTAILTSDGRDVVRGTIGARVQTPIASPLYQGWETAVGRSLAGGAAQLHFRLQEAGRIGGTSPVPASRLRALQVRRLDGSVVETPALDRRGRWRSGLLAPGRYAVALVPKAPLLPVAVPVEVRADEVVRAVLPAPQAGATIDGAVRADSDAVTGDVPVLLLQDDALVARTTTDDSGDYRFTGLAAGEYEVQVGRYAASDPVTPAASAVQVQVPVPGQSVTPTPSATAPAPASTAAPAAEAVAPPERLSDVVRPASSDVTVPDALGQVSVITSVVAAGLLRGRIDGTDGVPVQVVVEDGDGQVVRAVDAAADGGWSAGGLEQGERYTVWAVTRPDDPSLARMGSTDALATAATSAVDVRLDRAAVALQGTVVGTTSGTVTVGSRDGFTRSSTIDASGAYVVQGLVPGLLPAVVRTRLRLDADPVAVTVAEGSGPQDLQPGPRAAAYRGWFISGGAGAPLVSGTATSTSGTEVRLGPRSVEGHLTVQGLRPGTYAYDADSFAGTVPATDGPWWFDAPTGAFVLNDGATTDVGPVVLHVRAR